MLVKGDTGRLLVSISVINKTRLFSTKVYECDHQGIIFLSKQIRLILQDHFLPHFAYYTLVLILYMAPYIIGTL